MVMDKSTFHQQWQLLISDNVLLLHHPLEKSARIKLFHFSEFCLDYWPFYLFKILHLHAAVLTPSCFWLTHLTLVSQIVNSRWLLNVSLFHQLIKYWFESCMLEQRAISNMQGRESFNTGAWCWWIMVWAVPPHYAHSHNVIAVFMHRLSCKWIAQCGMRYIWIQFLSSQRTSLHHHNVCFFCVCFGWCRIKIRLMLCE